MTLRPFHRALGGVVVGLALLTLAIALVGDRTEPIPLSVRPVDGEFEVSAASSVVLRFGRPVSRDTLASYLVIDPPTPGTLAVEDAVARFVPAGQFRPATSYSITIQAGFQDGTGRLLRHEQRFAFRTRPAHLLFTRPEVSTAGAGALAPYNLWVATAEGTDQRPLVRNRLGVLFVGISPDGDRVAYSTPNLDAPNASSLWVANLDGNGRHQIAGDADGAILGLSWSPRGDLIAYERRSVIGVRGELGRPRIQAVRSDGGGAGLLYGRGDETGSQPVWSPDGRRLLVADAGRGGRTIVDPAAGPVTVPGYGSDSGSWSPDGQLIAFSDSESPLAERSTIKLANLDGQVVADLGRPGFSDAAPAWSPDGRWIAVVGRDDEGQRGSGCSIRTAARAGRSWYRPWITQRSTRRRSGLLAPSVWHSAGSRTRCRRAWGHPPRRPSGSSGSPMAMAATRAGCRWTGWPRAGRRNRHRPSPVPTRDQGIAPDLTPRRASHTAQTRRPAAE